MGFESRKETCLKIQTGIKIYNRISFVNQKGRESLSHHTFTHAITKKKKEHAIGCKKA